MSERRDFAAQKFDALLRGSLDATLPKLSARVMILLVTKYMHADRGGEAWPSIATLCSDLTISSDAAVRKALTALVKNGHLVAEHRPGATTRYSLSEGDPASNLTGVMEPTPVTFEADPPPSFEADPPIQNEADTPPSFEATSTVDRTPDIEHRKLITGKESPQSPSRRRKRSQSDLLSTEEARIVDAQFGQFWAIYIRKTDKAAARKAFEKAIASGVPFSEIIAGAERYANERCREPDPEKRVRYTKHAAAWLNGQRWEDEQAPRAAHSYGGNGHLRHLEDLDRD